ncbi:XRE family transcriptional regulator [Campylobacter sp. RM16187]|uniref:XRE family transcriptional regulator n=1 Tax=Campylobacter sp. RM16187 TaxID=1660063 RepID=UPI0021B4F863|nr:XRE family transcriptional regulator [Campylobacter sp. RM16187]QKG29180.1 hypothetical protein CDOMF_0916 [Campylobacter sp. RM16187]
MDINKFEEVLKSINLNKKDFAEMTGLAYQTIINWGSTNKVPSWVDTWLDNYIKAKSYEEIKNKVFDIEKVQK